MYDSDENVCASNFANFLISYLNELCNGPNFYKGNKFVIEGTHIDFEKLMLKIDENKYHIIGLVYESVTSKDLYKSIR